MSFDKTIGFLGYGNMAEALIRGLTRVVDPQTVGASGPRHERGEQLRERYGIRYTSDNTELVAHSDVLVLSVKPQILGRVLDQVRQHLRPESLIISVAAGVSIETIEDRVPAGLHVIRSMPNTPALVQTGATAIAAGTHATESDLEIARFVFDAVGITVTLDESQIDAVTGLSGSGPAYVFLILEALADAGVKVGLARRNAQRLAAQTVMGAAKMLLDTDEHPGRLKDMVTSPGGTAIAGLHTLEEGGLRTTLINAVESATKRARELGQRTGGKK